MKVKLETAILAKERGYTLIDQTQAELQTWLREKHNIIVSVDFKGTVGKKVWFGYYVQWYNTRWFHTGSNIEINYTWEEALEEAIIIGLRRVKITIDLLLPILENITLNDVKTDKLVRPHGENCGCGMVEYYSLALGCPNPTARLEISDLAKDYCDRYFRGDVNHPAYHHAYTAFVNGSKIK